MNTIDIATTDHRFRAIARAIQVYGDRLAVGPRRTETTLQGRTETGFVVWGRAHGGDQIGCLFPTRQQAQNCINAVMADE